MISVSDADFDARALAAGTTLVDFWAPWCGPCRALMPILEGLDRDSAGRVTFVKVNADEAPSVCARFQIQALPTLIVFKDGKEVSRSVGAIPRSSIEALLGA